MITKRLYLRVYGMVQGVGFRYFVYRIAKNLDIKGFVRNMPDGSVEIEAEGEERSLDEFVKRVNEGPPAALIERVITVEIPVVGDRDFEIRH